jgi:hypothetical protein
VVVLVVYILCVQRAEVRAWHAKRKRKYQQQQKKLGSPKKRLLEKGE